jgi:hypothetical protein
MTMVAAMEKQNLFDTSIIYIAKWEEGGRRTQGKKKKKRKKRRSFGHQLLGGQSCHCGWLILLGHGLLEV